MEVLMVVLKSLGISFGMCAIVLVIFFISMLFWVRIVIRDKVYCFFLSETKQLKGKLHKPDSNTIVVGKEADAPKYLIHSSKQFWSFWPPGLPRFVQEPIPTLFYVEGNAEPLDPYDRTALISPESLRKISDESMLRQMWKDVRETLGLKAAFGGNTLLLILVLVAVIASAAAAFMAFTTSGQLETILKMMGG